MRTYEPPPRKAPLLLRPARWSGGVPVALFVAVAFLAVPAVYGAVLVVWELDALIRGAP